MEKRIKKIIFAVMGAFAVAGVGICVYPASAGMSEDSDKTELNVTFLYNEGHTLDIEAKYTEYHSGINQHYRYVDSNTNMDTEVTYSTKAKEGYEFEIVSYTSKVDGTENAVFPAKRPR